MIRGITMEDCLFCKIAAGKIPVEKLYEDDDRVAGLSPPPG
jgi:diadenosine tetraphosphate (Ap4A) HIT family hydrolase